jgi:hypothetical protein
LSIEFEEPNIGADKSKVTITVTAFVNAYPTAVELKVYGDNKSGKSIRLEVSPDPLGKEVYMFFKNKIFKGCKQVRSLTTNSLTMFADWSIKPEEIEKVAIRARNLIGNRWEEAFKTEKRNK